MSTQNETDRAGAILGRIKDWLGVETDAELADSLGLAASTISSWRQRGSVPYAFCVHFALENEIGLDWLILGAEGAKGGLDKPWALGTGGDVLDQDALLLAIEELWGPTGLAPAPLLSPGQVAGAISDEYEKYTELLKQADDLGLTREKMIQVIRRVAKSRTKTLLLDLLERAARDAPDDDRG